MTYKKKIKYWPSWLQYHTNLLIFYILVGIFFTLYKYFILRFMTILIPSFVSNNKSYLNDKKVIYCNL